MVVCSEFQLIHELCLYVLSASQRTELIRATLSTLHAFLSWIPLGYIFESPLVGVVFCLKWNCFGGIQKLKSFLCFSPAWDTPEIFPCPSISEPHIAMFNWGIFLLLNAYICFSLKFLTSIFTFYICRWQPFNLGIIMMCSMSRCITYSWSSCRFVWIDLIFCKIYCILFHLILLSI